MATAGYHEWAAAAGSDKRRFSFAVISGLCGRMLRSAAPMALLAVGVNRSSAGDFRVRYAESLRKAGYSDWALEYLSLELNRATAKTERTAQLRFEVGAAAVAAASAAADPTRRSQLLDQAASTLGELAVESPGSILAAKAKAEIAHIELQRGQLLTLQAEAATDATQAKALAEKGRARMLTAIADYETAYKQMKSDYAKLPLFIPEEQSEARAEKSRLFEAYVEAWFQSGLARFLLAETYGPSAAVPASGTAASVDPERQKQVRLALQTFEEIYNAHRRELVGLYAHLWMARCLVDLGEHRRAAGIFDLLLKHDNRDLAGFQREAFHFELIATARRGDFARVVERGEAWMRDNARQQFDSAYQGVQWEVAQAKLQAKSTDVRAAAVAKQEALTLLGKLAAYPNPYSARARKEQLRLQGEISRDSDLRSVRQATSIAAARLDELKSARFADPKRIKALSDAESILLRAVSDAGPGTPADELNEARLLLAFVLLESGNAYEAAVLAESVARYFPRSPAAAQAASLALAAYSVCYDRAGMTDGPTSAPQSEFEARRIRSLADFLASGWPGSQEADAALAAVAKLEMSRGDFAAAYERLRTAAASPRVGPLILSLAGRSLRESLRAEKGGAAANPEVADRNAKALALMKRASALFREQGQNFDRDRLLNELATIELANELKDYRDFDATVQPVVDALSGGRVFSDIEPALLTTFVSLALRAAIQSGSTDLALKLLDVRLPATGKAAPSRVEMLLQAVRQARVNSETVESDATSRSQWKKTSRSLIDRVAGQLGESTIATRIGIAEIAAELGEFKQAGEMVSGVLAVEADDSDSRKQEIARARILLARCLAESGEWTRARATIDAIYPANRTSWEVVRLRGRILEGQRDFRAAATHWKDVIARTQQLKPRPEDFYRSIHCLFELAARLNGAEGAALLAQARYLANFVLRTDAAVNEHWRSVLEKDLRESAPTSR